MPFLCNGTLMLQGNLPRVLPVTIFKYASCLIPYMAFVSQLIKWLLFIFALGFGMHPLHAPNPTVTEMGIKKKIKKFKPTLAHNNYVHLEFCHSLQLYHCLFFLSNIHFNLMCQYLRLFSETHSVLWYKAKNFYLFIYLFIGSSHFNNC